MKEVGENARGAADMGPFLVVSFICHGQKDDALRQADQSAFAVRSNLHALGQGVGLQVRSSACPALAAGRGTDVFRRTRRSPAQVLARGLPASDGR